MIKLKLWKKRCVFTSFSPLLRACLHVYCLYSVIKKISLIESIVNFLFAERATRKSSTRISGSTQRAEDEFKWSNKYAGISGRKRPRQHSLSSFALRSVWVSDCWPVIPNRPVVFVHPRCLLGGGEETLKSYFFQKEKEAITEKNKTEMRQKSL